MTIFEGKLVNLLLITREHHAINNVKRSELCPFVFLVEHKFGCQMGYIQCCTNKKSNLQLHISIRTQISSRHSILKDVFPLLLSYIFKKTETKVIFIYEFRHARKLRTLFRRFGFKMVDNVNRNFISNKYLYEELLFKLNRKEFLKRGNLR